MLYYFNFIILLLKNFFYTKELIMAQNKFGGKWTLKKVEIFMKYVPAYITIMDSKIKEYNSKWKLIYFDGFAGSGAILKENEKELIESVAIQILDIQEPRGFDMYYLVERNYKKVEKLQEKLNSKFSSLKKEIYVVDTDGSSKIGKLADFMTANKEYKTLAFIDPFGLQVEWKMIEKLKGLSVDMWILLPTGMGIARMLKRDGKLEESWIDKIEYSLGLSKEEIEKEFYQKSEQVSLFEQESELIKKHNAISRVIERYKLNLKEIFKEVSEPFVMKNSKNSLMYHFIFCSNNKTAVKIANDIVKNMNYKID